MPLPLWVGHFNRVVTNNLTKVFVTRAPGFGVIIHRGRKSGRMYRTPVNVFRRPGGWVVALTYGPDADWLKNVLAAGRCELETRGKRIPLFEPRLVNDESRGLVPPVVRVPLGVMHVYDFLVLSDASKTGHG